MRNPTMNQNCCVLPAQYQPIKRCRDLGKRCRLVGNNNREVCCDRRLLCKKNRLLGNDCRGRYPRHLSQRHRLLAKHSRPRLGLHHRWLSSDQKMAQLPRRTPSQSSPQTRRSREVTHMARRIAAILLLEPDLNANYEAIKANTYDWPQ